jgi:hypothetical protein
VGLHHPDDECDDDENTSYLSTSSASSQTTWGEDNDDFWTDNDDEKHSTSSTSSSSRRHSSNKGHGKEKWSKAEKADRHHKTLATSMPSADTATLPLTQKTTQLSMSLPEEQALVGGVDTMITEQNHEQRRHPHPHPHPHPQPPVTKVKNGDGASPPKHAPSDPNTKHLPPNKAKKTGGGGEKKNEKPHHPPSHTGKRSEHEKDKKTDGPITKSPKIDDYEQRKQKQHEEDEKIKDKYYPHQNNENL